MTDADLIYNACLRAERRLEEMAKDGAGHPPNAPFFAGAFAAVHVLREEIGCGLSKEGR